MLKAYVRDYEHAGAEIYFCENKENAINYFRNKEIASIKKTISNHNVTSWTKEYNEKYLGRLQESIDYINSDRFVSEKIQEFEIKEGSSIFTTGEY